MSRGGQIPPSIRLDFATPPTTAQRTALDSSNPSCPSNTRDLACLMSLPRRRQRQTSGGGVLKFAKMTNFKLSPPGSTVSPPRRYDRGDILCGRRRREELWFLRNRDAKVLGNENEIFGSSKNVVQWSREVADGVAWSHRRPPYAGNDTRGRQSSSATRRRGGIHHTTYVRALLDEIPVRPPPESPVAMTQHSFYPERFESAVCVKRV